MARSSAIHSGVIWKGDVDLPEDPEDSEDPVEAAAVPLGSSIALRSRASWLLMWKGEVDPLLED